MGPVNEWRAFDKLSSSADSAVVATLFNEVDVAVVVGVHEAIESVWSIAWMA